MKIYERQKELDKQIWDASVNAETNMAGRMAFCDFCKFQYDTDEGVMGCQYADNDERCTNNYCAKAFRKMSKDTDNK